MVTTFHKESISAEESKRIKYLAAKLAFEASFCGPLQIESRDCIRTSHRMIRGFDEERAKEVFEDLIWRFLMDEEYGKASER